MASFKFTPVELTPMDHMMPVCYIAFFCFFRVENPERAVSVLQESLIVLLKGCPFLDGNVTKSKHSGQIANVLEVRPPTIDSLREYPVLKTAHHKNVRFSQLAHQYEDRLGYDSLFNDCYLPLPLALATSNNNPVIRWQANIMQDGIIMTVCFHHSVLDAMGFYSVMQELGRLCREHGEHSGPLESFALEADLQEGRQVLIHSMNSRQTCVAKENCSSPALQVDHFSSGEKLTSRRLNLESETIQMLLKACNDRLGLLKKPFTSERSPVLSSIDVVAALMWVAIIRARYGSYTRLLMIQDNLPTTSDLVLLKEVRHVLKPPLPTYYLGNASVQPATTTSIQTALGISHFESQIPQMDCIGIDKKELDLLAGLAVKVHEIKGDVDDAYVKELINTKQGSLDWSSNFKKGDITFTSLRHMRLYELNFGAVLGKVTEFENPDNRIDGSVCVLPSRLDSKLSSWEIRITLKPDAMDRLERDSLILWAAAREKARL